MKKIIFIFIIIIIILTIIFFPEKKQEFQTVNPEDIVGRDRMMNPTEQIPSNRENGLKPKIMAPDRLIYYGITGKGRKFAISYSEQWAYHTFKCNTSGIALWPKSIYPVITEESLCSATSTLDTAPVIIYTDSDFKMVLKDDSYRRYYDEIKDSLNYE